MARKNQAKDQQPSEPPPTLEELLLALRNPDQEQRTQVFLQLFQPGNDPLPTLHTFLTVKTTREKNSSRVLDDEVKETLLNCGGAVVPYLFRLAFDDGTSSDAAVDLLFDLDYRAASAVPFLLEQLHKAKQDNSRSMLIAIVSNIGPAAGAVVGQIIQALEVNPTGDNARRYVYSLEKLGPAAAPAVPILVKILQNCARSPSLFRKRKRTGEDFLLLMAVSHTLCCIGPSAASAVPDLIQLLTKNKDISLRRDVIRILGHIGPAAYPAVCLLQTIRDTPNNTLESYPANQALAKILEPVPAFYLSLAEKDENGQNETSAVDKLQIDESLLQEREQLPDQPKEAPTTIEMAEIATGRKVVEQQQEEVVRKFQDWLDSLVGRRAETQDDNKRIADEVYDTARCAGIRLICKNQAAYLRFAKGVFELLTMDSSRTWLDSSATFPQLTARSKQFKDSNVSKQAAAGKWSQDVQKSQKGGKSRGE